MSPTTVLKFLDDLIRPGSRPFLVAFTAALTLVGSALLFMLWTWGKDERFNKAFHLGTLWIHLQGGPNNPALAKTTAAAPVAEFRRYRKLLYIKVVYLSNRALGAPPFYTRIVERLAETERSVPVYDEAVYYTLKQFPAVQPLLPEEDSSSGIVDARLLIPWTDIELHPFAFRNPHSEEITASEQSDTLCAVAHFLNGLQGDNQNFCTFADADAESLSLVVDFSSIPNAATRITLKQVRVVTDTHSVTLPCKNDGGVYTAQRVNAKKGELLQMDFIFNDWDVPA